MVTDFSDGYLSSDGRALLLRQVDRSVRLSRALADCFVDRRDAHFVEHGVRERVAQRLCALMLGYEDLNDHADLRRDPLLPVAADKPDPLGTNRRLVLASFAQLLLERLRTRGLAGTTLARATAGTIRLPLLKLAAQVTVSVRRVGRSRLSD